MGDLLFFVYTSTPHRQNDFQSGQVERIAFLQFVLFSVSFRHLFMRFYTMFYSLLTGLHTNTKQKRESHFTTPFNHCRIFFSCMFTIRLNASNLSIGALMPTDGWNRKPTMFFGSALNSSLTPPTIEIVGFLGGTARSITKLYLKQRVMRFPTVRYGCSV